MNNKDYSRASKLVMLAAALLDFSKKGFATLMPGPLGVILAFVLWVNSWLNSGREFEAHQRNLSFFLSLPMNWLRLRIFKALQIYSTNGKLVIWGPVL